MSEQTATIRSDTSETSESQTQLERTHEGLLIMTELRRQEEAISVVALVATQFMLQNVVAKVEREGHQVQKATASQVTWMQVVSHENLGKMHVEMSMNFNCAMSKMKDTVEGKALRLTSGPRLRMSEGR